MKVLTRLFSKISKISLYEYGKIGNDNAKRNRITGIIYVKIWYEYHKLYNEYAKREFKSN